MNTGSTQLHNTSAKSAHMNLGHVYKSTFSVKMATLKTNFYKLLEMLMCEREMANLGDRYAVSVTRSDTIVCSLFLRHGGAILREIITGRRRCSRDLAQDLVSNSN